MTVLIFEVHLKAADTDDGRKISVKIEAGELPAVIEMENIP